ncbi:MAG: QueT transporter family protein [Clostridia bacterium]|nr:QueT transporter family protein [Clostridia bacterium]
MKNQKTLSRYIVTAALIAAAYAALTYLSAAFGLAYGGIQFRLSEALNILAAFTPAAIPGLVIGCIIGNIGSPMGLIDVAIGTVATLLAAISIRLLARLCKNATPFVGIIPPTLFNAVLVGLEITWFLPEGVTWAGFSVIALEVAIGEIAVCGALGVPLYFTAKKYMNKLFKLEFR